MLVADQAEEGGEAGLPVETYHIGGRETVSSQPAHPPPENSHRVKNGRGGAIQPNSTGE